MQTNGTAIKDTTSHEYSYLINEATTFILTQPKIELLPDEDSDTKDNYHSYKSSTETDHEASNIFNTNETIEEIKPDIPSETPSNHQETETILIDSIIQQQITNIDKDDPENHIMLLDFDNQPINQISIDEAQKLILQYLQLVSVDSLDQLTTTTTATMHFIKIKKNIEPIKQK